VILLPAAFFMEKNGTISNSGGMVQWRHAAVKPPGRPSPTARSSTSCSARCAIWSRTRRSRGTRSSRRPSGPTPRPRTSCARSTATPLRDNPETGLKKGDLVRKVSDLQADGSTSSGAWIYAGVFANGENLSKRRDSQTDPGGLGLYPGFGWTWPNNMRILYNRASCDRTASRIRARNRSSGGTSRRSAGRDTTCRTSPC
jgi:formate dehydrogenase major subunit